jgi:hypothetical protein
MTRIDGANHLKQGFKSFKEDKKAKNSNIDMKRKFYLTVSNICLVSWHAHPCKKRASP